MSDGWRRFNDQFRETEWERNARLRKARLKKATDAKSQIEEQAAPPRSDDETAASASASLTHKTGTPS